jgi:molybdopterin molybdotransferase
MMGHTRIYRAVVTATLQENFRKSDAPNILCASFFNRKMADMSPSTTGAQGSGILRSMSKANGLMVVDEERMQIQAGESVAVMLVDCSLSMSSTREF